MSGLTTYFVSTGVVFFIILGLMYLCNGLRLLSSHNRHKRRVDGRNVGPTIFVVRRQATPAVRINNNTSHRIDTPDLFADPVQVHGNTPPPTYLESHGAATVPAFFPPPTYTEATSTRVNVY